MGEGAGTVVKTHQIGFCPSAEATRGDEWRREATSGD